MGTPKEKIKRRITIKPKICPNPLFEKWLLEWKEEADQQDSKLKFTYSRALAVLRKYPIPLKSGKECLILKHFGAHICDKLDRKLAEYEKSHPERTQPTSIGLVKVNQDIETKKLKRKKNKNLTAVDVPKSKKMNKAYIPAFRSGAYAIILALFEEQTRLDYPGYMYKSELQAKAQPLCNVSLTTPDPGSRYTGWSSMSTLKSKGLVRQEGNPARYSLTNEGKEIAVQLKNFVFESINIVESSILTGLKSSSNILKDERNTDSDLVKSKLNKKLESKQMTSPLHGNRDKAPSGLSSSVTLLDNRNCNSNSIKDKSTVIRRIPDCQSSDDSQGQNFSQQGCSTTSSVTTDDTYLDEQLIFLPNSFKIIILLDTAEVTGYAESDSDEIIKELRVQNVDFEVRHLNVGDFLWICRDTNGKELVLPYVVERKRMDDFAKSIKDGRFHEQKFRLKQCGLQNVIYLIEKYSPVIGLPLNTLQQAMVNTQIIDEFFVKVTNSYRDTVYYLARMTKILISTYKEKMLLSCPKNNLSALNIIDDTVSLMTFENFSKYSAKKSKNFKVGEMFIKHLIQIRGLTVEKAIAIVGHYPTPRHLISAYHNSTQGEMLLSNIKYGYPPKRIGPHISMVLHQLYTKSLLT